MSITTTGFICQDADGIAIHGIGETEDAAWAETVDGVGNFDDAHGNDITPEQAREAFAFYPATAALLAEVAEKGGAISWSIEDGVAMTDTEADPRAFLLAYIAEAGEEAVEQIAQAVREVENVETVEVDAEDAAIWLEGPQVGHWANDNQIRSIARHLGWLA